MMTMTIIIIIIICLDISKVTTTVSQGFFAGNGTWGYVTVRVHCDDIKSNRVGFFLRLAAAERHVRITERMDIHTRTRGTQLMCFFLDVDCYGYSRQRASTKWVDMLNLVTALLQTFKIQTILWEALFIISLAQDIFYKWQVHHVSKSAHRSAYIAPAR